MRMLRLLIGSAVIASISGTALAKDSFPNNVADLYVAEANFLDATDRQALATTRLQEALERGLSSDQETLEKLKARSAISQLNWGMHYLPSAILQQLVDRPKPHKIDDQIWLDLATLQFRRGYWGLTGTVEYSLSRVSKRPRREIRGGRTLLRSQLYLKQNRFAQADRSLSRYRGNFDDQPFAEFNRAIALLKQNNSEEGAALLDKVGNMRTNDDELLALRDLANYTLGNWFLNQEQAGTAIPLLKKVRAEGPYSNKALLALGWAYLSDTGKLQRVDEIFSPRCIKNALAKSGTIITNTQKECRPGRTLRIENVGAKEQKRLQRAMTAWQIVQERNPLFPGVQETLMALPFALDQMGYTHVAETQYKKAIESLKYEAKRINDALDVIHSGQLLEGSVPSYQAGAQNKGWDLSTLKLGEKLDTRLLYRLYSEHEFYEALVNYRQLRQLQSQVGERLASLKALAASNRQGSRRLRVRDSLKIQTESNANSSISSAPSSGQETRKRLLGSLDSSRFSTRLTNKDSQNKRPESKLTVWMTHEKTAANSLNKRINELLPKTETLYKQLGNLAAKHAGYLSVQSETELNVQLDRVNTYMAQARLSLGRINDRQADQRINGSASSAPKKIEEIEFDAIPGDESED